MNKLRNNSLAVVDVETTGVNPFHHQVLAVAVVPLIGDKPPLELYIRPTKIEWSPYAQENFKKFSQAWEASATSPTVACNTLEMYFSRNFSGRVTLIGHNIGFDLSFLKQLAHLGGRDELSNVSHRAIDTHTLLYLLYAQEKIPQSALTSDGAFEYFGIQLSDATRHTALGDANATRELFMKIVSLLGEDSTVIVDTDRSAGYR